MNSIKTILNSFKFAFTGIFELFRNERNAKIHLLASILTVGLGLILGINSAEWCIVTMSIFLVFSAEAFNTAIEKLSDITQPEHDERIRVIKDVSAGAVLLITISAIIIGLIIFLPKFY